MDGDKEIFMNDEVEIEFKEGFFTEEPKVEVAITKKEMKEKGWTFLNTKSMELVKKQLKKD